MTSSLYERLKALREFLAPPCVNSLSPPGLDLLDEAIKALAPVPPGEPAPTAVEMPWPNLPAGSRLVTSAYPRSVVADYGNARAAERDAFWQLELNRLAVVGEASTFAMREVLSELLAIDTAVEHWIEDKRPRSLLLQAITDNIRSLLAAALTPSPAPSAAPHQGADALREAADHWMHKAHESQAERDDLRHLLDTRPALNAGLAEAYREWTGKVYAADIHRANFKADKAAVAAPAIPSKACRHGARSSAMCSVCSKE